MASTRKKGGLGAESYFENIPTLAPAEEREPAPEVEQAQEATEENVADSDADILEEGAESEAMVAPSAEAGIGTEAVEEGVAVTHVAMLEEEAESETPPESIVEALEAEQETSEPKSTGSEDEDTEEVAEPPQRQKIRRTYALYEETQIALEEMKLAARKQGVKKTLGDLLEEAVQLLMEQKGMVGDSELLDY